MATTFIIMWIVVPQISSVRAEAPQVNIDESISHLHEAEYSKEEIINLVGLYAAKYGVDEFVMQQVVFHESGYDPKNEGDYYNGKYNSFGLSQIHLPSHPNVTREQAEDPHFALEFMAKNIKAGRGRMWTGYRLCILNETIIFKGQQLHCVHLTK